MHAKIVAVCIWAVVSLINFLGKFMNSLKAATANTKTILVIGAYGLIGSGIAQRLEKDGHIVIGLGRDIITGKQVLPSIKWRCADLRSLTQPESWLPFIEAVDAVVNCSGALQDGYNDDLELIHNHAIAALAKSCSDANIHIIQISAAGVSLDATTQFFSSKARGDAAIQSAGAQYHIFRPGLVLAPHSYGSTALLRMLAAFPVVQPIAVPEAQIQTISLDDVALAVSAAVEGKIPTGFIGDLVEEETHSLRDVIALIRGWLGYRPARFEICAPAPLTWLVAKVADGLALLGWRSPLRTTAFTVLTDGVTGLPTDLSEFNLPAAKSLSQTLANMPARVEDRLFARIALLTPIMVATLAGFWLLSGVISLFRTSDAALVLEQAGWPHWLAIASVLFWAVIDIGIAAAFIYRPYVKRACWAAVAVSLFYLAASSIFVPQLWLDLLGPLVKVIPSIVLAILTRIALENR